MMLSRAELVVWAEAAKPDVLDLQAGVLCLVEEIEGKRICLAVASYGVPLAPLNGNENKALADVVFDCNDTLNRFHEHSMGKWALSNTLPRLGSNLHKITLCIYCPVEHERRHYHFLGFAKNNVRGKSEATTKGVALALAEIVSSRLDLNATKQRLDAVELYIKEVGHDFAGSVHAVLAKVTMIQLGQLSDTGMRRKAGEAVTEIRNAYAVAEGLGVAVDRQYTLGNIAPFNLGELLGEAVKDFHAEAKERNITFKKPFVKGVTVYGERLSFKLALTNLIKNAIKYSHSDTEVELGFRVEGDRLVIFVRNKGIGLPPDESTRIWDFGFRCSRARKLNVNGSGIGLYTCKKIILAHHGQVWYEDHPGGFTTFFIGIPMGMVKLT